MTDNSPWQPPTPSAMPTAAPTSIPAPAPSIGGAPETPGWAAPPAAGPSVGGTASTPGWTPPPRPGLLPLHPLTLGNILSGSFQVLRRNPKPTFGVALLVQGVVLLVTLGVVGVVTVLVVERTAMAEGEDVDALMAGAIGSILLASVVPVLLSIVAAALMQGVIVLEVARGTVGEKLRFSGLWRMARGRIWALVGWVLLVTLVVVIVLAVAAVAIAVLVIISGDAGPVVGILLAVVAVLGGLVLTGWLATRLSLVPSTMVIERLPMGRAVARAWRLTIGYFWRTLGIQLLVAVIVQVASQVITMPLTLLFGLAMPFFELTDDSATPMVIGGALYLLLGVMTVVVAAVALVVQSATTAIVYVDLRMRKEGLDLELARFVEARQTGDGSVPDPFLR